MTHFVSCGGIIYTVKRSEIYSTDDGEQWWTAVPFGYLTKLGIRGGRAPSEEDLMDTIKRDASRVRGHPVDPPVQLNGRHICVMCKHHGSILGVPTCGTERDHEWHFPTRGIVSRCDKFDFDYKHRYLTRIPEFFGKCGETLD